MEKYIIKKTQDGVFLKVSVWRKEWSESFMSNITSFIDSKKFIIKRSSVDIWIAKTILNDLNNRDRMEICNNGKSRTFTASS